MTHLNDKEQNADIKKESHQSNCYPINNQKPIPREIELLMQMRSVAGITAEYLMTFLDKFTNQSDLFLLYSVSCNYHRLQHTIEIHLLEHGVLLSGVPYDAGVFVDVDYIDENLVKSIRQFLDERYGVGVVSMDC